MKRVAAILLAIGFLLYALMRLSGIGLLIATVMGGIDSASAKDALDLMQDKLPGMNESAVVPLPMPAYLTYSFVMGVVLLVGAIGALMNKVWGVIGIFGYYVLFALMFLNYGTANAKLLHLGIGIVLAAILALLVLKSKPRGTQGA